MKNIINFIKKNKYIFLLILLYSFFFIQMQLIQFYGDDYQVLYPLHGSRNFVDILNYCLDKMNFFWYEWSGRIVGHFTVSFGLSIFGIQFFRIINPLMVFLMSFLCLKILKLKHNFSFLKYLFYLSFLIISCNIYISRESLYWAYAGILYIWGFNLTLFVVYFVYKYYLKDEKIPLILKIILSIFCLLQSFILETISFINISFLLLIIIFSVKKKKSCQFIIFLLLISILSFLISALAPGNVPRTIPLKEELQGFSLLQIILGKTHGFFTMIFHPSIYGFYMGIFLILICKKYLKITDKKFYSKIPIFFVISYFILVFIYKALGINILLFFNTRNIDALQFASYNPFYLILIDLYYIFLIGNVFYMIFKTTFKKNKFLFFSIVITFISSIIPIICIRYIGTRYYLPFFLNILMFNLMIYFNLERKEFNFVDITCLIVISFSSYIMIIVLYVYILTTILFKHKNNYYNLSSKFITMCILISLVINMGLTFNGYMYNSQIYKENDEKLSTELSDSNNVIILKEVPYKYGLYSWHSNVLDFNNYHIYYGFYLNEFYSNYYGISMEQVHILGINGNYY